MVKIIRSIFILGFLLILIYPTISFSETFTSEQKESIINWVRFTYKLSTSYKIEISNPVPTKIPGLELIKITISNKDQQQTIDFFISKDRKYLFIGNLRDLTLDPKQEVMKNISLEGSPTRGKEGAKVILIEYADFQCPFCQKAAAILEKVLKNYEDKITYVYKHFPVENIHPWAKEASISAQCAYIQKKEAFWNFYYYFYNNQKEINQKSISKVIMYLAGNTGLNFVEFNRCLNQEEVKNIIDRDIQEGIRLGINSIPTFIINGRILVGAKSFEDFKNIIDEELQLRR